MATRWVPRCGQGALMGTYSSVPGAGVPPGLPAAPPCPCCPSDPALFFPQLSPSACARVNCSPVTCSTFFSPQMRRAGDKVSDAAERLGKAESSKRGWFGWGKVSAAAALPGCRVPSEL